MTWPSPQLGREARENLVDLATRCVAVATGRPTWKSCKHPPPGVCFVCGYDMRALTYPSLCPECGSWPDTRWETVEPAWARQRTA